MKVIDARGKLCPEPLILTKKGLESAVPDEYIQILSDNDTACANLAAYLSELNLQATKTCEAGLYTFSLTVPARLGTLAEVDQFCTPEKDPGYIVVIRSETMGAGDDTLGAMLMRAFVNSLLAADKLPTAVLLYNSGVRIAVRGTDTADTLTMMEEKGIVIYVCGTCVDFFELNDSLAVGMIGNMYTMTKYMTEAPRIVYP